MFELKDLSGQEIGIWKVLNLDHVRYGGSNGKHGMSYYNCECKKCGRVVLVPRSTLTQSKNLYHMVNGRKCNGTI